MTQIDREFMQITTGNAGAMPTGAIVPAKPEDAKSPPLQIIVGSQKPPQVYAYIRGLTPDNLSMHLESFDRGFFRQVIPVWRKMAHRNGHLLAVSEKRLGRVAALDWRIQPLDDSREAQAQAEYLKAFLEAIPEFSCRLEHLAEAIKYSVSGCEIEWLPNGGPEGKLGARLWPQNPEDFDASSGTLQLYVREQLTPLPPDKFLVHRLAVALLEPSSILYVMKLITAGQWMAFGEKFGMPGILGTAPAGASEADVTKFYEMLMNWAQDFVAACREGYTVTTLPAAGGNGTITYPQLIAWADDEDSKIWTGHTVTSQAKSGTGTLAGEAGQEQLDELVAADGVRLARTIEKGLCEPAVRFQLGQPLLVRFTLQPQKPMSAQDKQAEATTDALLVNQLGLPLPIVDLYSKYNWRQPKDGEEVTSPRQQPLASGSDGSYAAAFKIAGTPDQIQAARAAMTSMIEPLSKLIENAGQMSAEDLRRQVLKLALPVEGFAGELERIILQAHKNGQASMLAKAAAALQQGGES